MKSHLIIIVDEIRFIQVLNGGDISIHSFGMIF